MVENTEQPQQEEAQGESKIAQGFAAAREKVMQESAEISEIYRSITKPGVKDVYNAWVKNMDVVANSYSLGRDKAGFKTRILYISNRLVGIGAATTTGLVDLALNVATWLPRKIPFVGHFLPHDAFKKHTIRMAEAARREALVARGVGKVIDAPGAIIAAGLKRGPLGGGLFGIPETRAAWQYVGKKVTAIKDAILHPKAA